MDKYYLNKWNNKMINKTIMSKRVDFLIIITIIPFTWIPWYFNHQSQDNKQSNTFIIKYNNTKLLWIFLS